MAAANFSACLAIILKEEGGNDDDPQDHGGRTSRGIIQHEWDVFRKTHPDRPEDVWQAPQADIETIYREQYWNPFCDDMPAGVDLEFFNASVNSGRTQATKELQRALGISADGMFGMATKQAVTDYQDIPALISAMADKRRAFYQALAQFPHFGKGWMARTERVQASALKMATAQPAVKSHAIPDTSSPKASPADVATTTVSPETSGGVSAGVGTMSGMLQTLRDQLTPFSDSIKYVQYILLVLALIGVGYTIYGVIKRNKVQQAVG